jgi:hypothetical protein
MQEMGINKLANMYLGNPQPLAQKVQQAQQQAQPGQLPPDLEQAIALQKIQEMRQAAQNQQAMQAGGQQPTIMDKLRQMMQPQMQAQPQGMPPQMPGQPPQAPQGINQLPAQFGLAGGGIVAFSGKDDSEVPEAEEPRKKRHYTLSEQGADWEARLQAARDAEAASQQGATSIAGNVGRAVMEPLKGLANAAATAWQNAGERQKLQQQEEKARPGLFEALTPEQRAAREAQLSELRTQRQQVGNTPAAPAAPVAMPKFDSGSAGGWDNAAPARPPVAGAAGQRPPVNRVPGAAGAAGAVANTPQGSTAPGQAPQGLDALLESGIREAMGRNQDTESQKSLDKYRELSGMSEYQKQMADMVARREAAQKEARENRTPEWVRGLQALGGAPVRGGLGMVLAQAGRGATAARDTYGEEDAKYANELDALRKAAMDAQLKGNMELAKTYTDRYHQVAQEKQQALQSGVGLQSNRNTVAQREQAERHHNEQMNENRAARAQAAAQALSGKGQLTYDQASDNADKWMQSQAGVEYLSRMRKESKESGKPMPSMLDIREQLIKRAMQTSGSAYAGRMAGAEGSSSGKMSTPPPGFKLD